MLAALLIALTLGAVAGGLLMVHARDFAPLLPLCASALVVVIAAVRFPARHHATETRAAGDQQNAPLPADARWSYYATFASPLKASVAFGVRDIRQLRQHVHAHGYQRVRIERMLRRA